MTSSSTRTLKPRRHSRRVAVTLSLSLLVVSSLIPAAAQVGNQKRITSVWTATSADGSRVHVDSDSPLNDYAGYTRGDRFYVTIPLAELPSARGSLLGRGFDDVQIQKYGDGIIISFHLQPGTTAHVQQMSNRLEVVFSTPGRDQSVGSETGTSERANRTRVRRIRDVAGPVPESNNDKSAPRRSFGVRSFIAVDGAPKAPTAAQRAVKTPSPKASSGNGNSVQSSGSKSSQNGQNATAKPATAKPSPQPIQGATPGNAGSSASATPATSKSTSSPSPSPVASANPSSSPTATPSASASPSGESVLTAQASPQPPVSTATPTIASNSGDSQWATRLHYWKIWAELNWLPLLIGGLVFLGLLVLLFVLRGAKRRRVRSKPAGGSAKREAPSVSVATPANAPSFSASSSGHTEAVVAPKSSQPSSAEQHERGSEDQEREVFEL